MSRRPPPWFESWAAADAAFDLFVADLPLRREQLRWMVAESGGPELDGTVDSLTPLNEWYIETALRGEPDGMDWWPVWLERSAPVANPAFDTSGYPPEGVIERLWDLVSVYVGDVLIPLIPHARWVCFRAKAYRDGDNGHIAVDIGNPDRPARVMTVANANVPRIVYDREAKGSLEILADPTYLYHGVYGLVDRYEAAEDAGTLRWQLAPTGPDAHRRTSRPTW